jgi:hypothetical protein
MSLSFYDFVNKLLGVILQICDNDNNLFINIHSSADHITSKGHTICPSSLLPILTKSPIMIDGIQLNGILTLFLAFCELSMCLLCVEPTAVFRTRNNKFLQLSSMCIKYAWM